MSTLIIREGLLQEAGREIARVVPPCQVAIVSDSRVAGLHAQTLDRSLTEAGYQVCHHSFPAGENSKNAATYVDILNFLAGQGLGRDGLVIALGGGVTGDLVGFAAATYLRGVKLVQVPTSLLACVDSSVGGKTGIDLEAGKNLVGAFHPAVLVLIDPAVLRTLPESALQDGMAEVIKCAFIDNRVLPGLLEKEPLPLEAIIRACVAIKQDIVARDPQDRGDRQLLNLGHTVGHAVERLSDYQLSHGRAVAIGLAVMARACVRRGLCPASAYERMLGWLERWQLPWQTDYAARDIYRVMLSDKKRSGDHITLITLDGAGLATLTKLPLQEAEALVREGLPA